MSSVGNHQVSLDMSTSEGTNPLVADSILSEVTKQRNLTMTKPLEVKWRGYQMPHHWWLHCATKQSLSQRNHGKKPDGFRTWASPVDPELLQYMTFVSVLWRKLKNTLLPNLVYKKCPFWWGNQYTGLAILQLCSSRIGCKKVPPVASPCTSSTDPPPWHIWTSDAQVQEVPEVQIGFWCCSIQNILVYINLGELEYLQC